jgi:cholesterol 25-hydroxylase
MAINPAQSVRFVLLGLCSSAILCPALYQPLLDWLWSFLRETRIYQWSTFETLWTVFCYALVEVWMTALFIRNPGWRLRSKPTVQSADEKQVAVESTSSRTKPRGMRRPSRRIGEILIYMLPLLAMDLTMIKKFADVPLSAILASGGYKIDFAKHGSFGLLKSPPRTFLIPTFHNFSISSPLQLNRALSQTAPTSRRIAVELITSMIIYDLLFFLFHLSLHTVPAFRRWHATHHAHDAQLNPQVTNQLSILERLGLVLLANFSLNIIRSHVLTRTVFVPMFVWLLVEIHCGMDLPWGYEKVLPAGWGGGAKKHMYHHKVGDRGFEPFFCWCDALWDFYKGANPRRDC